MLCWIVTTLAVAFALVPPGICACRLEALMLAEPSESEAECPDEDGDHHDCDCARIQQDCVISSGPLMQVELDGAAAWVMAPPMDSTSPSEVLSTPAPFRWPDLPPLYLMLRALLL